MNERAGGTKAPRRSLHNMRYNVHGGGGRMQVLSRAADAAQFESPNEIILFHWGKCTRPPSLHYSLLLFPSPPPHPHLLLSLPPSNRSSPYSILFLYSHILSGPVPPLHFPPSHLIPASIIAFPALARPYLPPRPDLPPSPEYRRCNLPRLILSIALNNDERAPVPPCHRWRRGLSEELIHRGANLPLGNSQSGGFVHELRRLRDLAPRGFD